jgi:hypothetical protein
LSDFSGGNETRSDFWSLQTAATFFGLVFKNLAGAGDLDPGKSDKNLL